MTGKKLLLVEGKDDQHVIYAIRDIYGIDKDVFKIQDKEGIDNLFEGFELNLIEGSSALQTIGIVIDADSDLNARWQKTTAVLSRADYQNLLGAPDPNGTIIREDFKPTVGVWIMPNNQIHGMLEDFLGFLVPENSKVWEKAVECSEAVLEMEEETFSDIHLSKAQIHAYLAWQKEPGKPFGTAITARYLQSDNPQCQTFVDWLNRLFVES